jgi:hypothetical protein
VPEKIGGLSWLETKKTKFSLPGASVGEGGDDMTHPSPAGYPELDSQGTGDKEQWKRRCWAFFSL